MSGSEFESRFNKCFKKSVIVALVVFWDGKSKGTKNMIDNASINKLKVRVVYY